MIRIILSLIFPLNLYAATVLFIGDSHSVGPFGWQLDENLRQAGHQVATYASCGSIPKWWNNGQKTTCGYFSKDLKGMKTQTNAHPTPLIKNLLNDIRPDVVILEFGGNYVYTPSEEFIINDMKGIVQQVKASGAQCFWVTNPDTRSHKTENPRVWRLIKEAISNECPIFESQTVTKYPASGGDGIHYWFAAGTPIAKEWANKTFDFFRTFFP